MTPEMAANYIASQQKRLKDAQASKNNDLATRLINDISRVQGKYPTLKKTNNSINNVPFINYDSIYTNNNAKTPMQMVTNQGLAELKQKQEAYKQENQLKTDAPVTNSTSSTMNINTPSNTFNYNPMNDERFKAYFQPVQAFTYDPKSDPLYQTALQNALSQARANAKVASQNALESLNERGISNSSIASNQLAQIEQNALTGAQSQLESNLIPQLVNQAYQRYQDNINNQRYQADLARGLTNDNYQRFMDSITNNRADQQLALQRGELLGNVDGVETLAAKNANRNFGLQKGELLGNYEGQKTLSNINSIEDNKLKKLTLEESIRSNKANELNQKNNVASNLQLDREKLQEQKRQFEVDQLNKNKESSKSQSNSKPFDITSEYNTLLKTPFVRKTIDDQTGEESIFVYDKTGLTNAIMSYDMPNQSKVTLFKLFNMTPPNDLLNQVSDRDILSYPLK